MELLGTVRQECPDLKISTPSSLHWAQFDAVRVAGYDELGTKRSVKILSLDDSTNPNNSLPILSFKDKRIFEAFRPPDSKFYRIQQATRFVDGLFLLHDQLLFASPTKVCIHGEETLFAAFGVTADLLLSGVWLCCHEPYGRLIQSKILEFYSALSGPHATTDIFAKSYRFSVEHIEWLTNELLDLYFHFDQSFSPLRCCCCSLLEPIFLSGKYKTSYTNDIPNTDMPKPCLSQTPLNNTSRQQIK